jgi:biopolymer transport protein ExbD
MAQSTHDPDEPITQINVVPLVDIMLVLLIIFMLTASFIAVPTVPVHLPKANSTDPSLPRSISIVLNTKDEIFYQGQKTLKTDLAAQLKESSITNPELRVVLSADGSVDYAKVVELLDAVRQAGVSQVALGTEKP